MTVFYRCLGLILLMASLGKMLAPDQFVVALRSYGLLPGNWLGPAADWVVALEFVLGLELLRRPGAAVRLWVLFLFVAFSTALGLAIARRLPLNCGCFGPVLANLHSIPGGGAIHLLINLAVVTALLGSFAREGMGSAARPTSS